MIKKYFILLSLIFSISSAQAFQMGVNPYDPENNIREGIKYINGLLKHSRLK